MQTVKLPLHVISMMWSIIYSFSLLKIRSSLNYLVGLIDIKGNVFSFRKRGYEMVERVVI